MTRNFKPTNINVDRANELVQITIPVSELLNLRIAMVRAVNTWQDPPLSMRKLKNDILDLTRELELKP